MRLSPAEGLELDNFRVERETGTSYSDRIWRRCGGKVGRRRGYGSVGCLVSNIPQMGVLCVCIGAREWERTMIRGGHCSKRLIVFFAVGDFDCCNVSWEVSVSALLRTEKLAQSDARA